MFPLQHSNQERVPLRNLETLEMTCWPQMNIANWLVLSVTLMMWSGIANEISWRRSNQQRQQKKVVIRKSWEKHPQKKNRRFFLHVNLLARTILGYQRWRAKVSLNNLARWWKVTQKKKRRAFRRGFSGHERATDSPHRCRFRRRDAPRRAAGVSRASGVKLTEERLVWSLWLTREPAEPREVQNDSSATPLVSSHKSSGAVSVVLRLSKSHHGGPCCKIKIKIKNPAVSPPPSVRRCRFRSLANGPFRWTDCLDASQPDKMAA